MKYLGNLTEDQIIYFRFNTHTAAGLPITLASGALSVYKADDDTQSTAGIVLTLDDDSITGMHTVKIDTSANAFYATGYDYSVVITTGTVDGTSVVGTVLATFSIENRYKEADVVSVGGTAVTLATEFDVSDASLTEIKTTMEAAGSYLHVLYDDWLDGGRLDLLLDAAAAGSSGGTGARTVTITVNDGTTALESASVRLTKGAETYIQTTNVSGVATFNVDDGTWVVSITLANYTYAGTTLVVNGDETATYSMAAITIAAPAGPGLTTGYVLCLGTDGLAESGVTITARMTEGPGTVGYAVDRGTITMTSGVDGVAQHTGFVRGAWYKFKRGTDPWMDAVLAPATATWALPEILGMT